MKYHSIHKHPAGGAMVSALVFTGIVAGAFTVWASLISQRARDGDFAEQSVRRRVATWNAKSSIREYALQRVVASNADADGISYNPSSGWGSISASAWTDYPMMTDIKLAGLNSFSPSWNIPYSKLLNTQVGNKRLTLDYNEVTQAESQNFTDTSTYYRTYVRSHSLPLGGYLLVMHRPRTASLTPNTITGNIHVYGGVMHFLPEQEAATYEAKSQRFSSPDTGSNLLRPKNLNGDNMPASNMAWTPVTCGTVDGVVDYTGKLAIIDENGNAGNSLTHRIIADSTVLNTNGSTAYSEPRGIVNDGNGIVTINTVTTPTVYAPHVIIRNEVTEIVINGQDEPLYTDTASYLPAFVIVYTQTETSVRKLQRIRFKKQSNRRFIIAIKQEGATAGSAVNIIVEDTNAVSNWHTVITAENTPLTFTPQSTTGTIKLWGGIQTDRSITGPTGTATLAMYLETNTRGLIRYGPRAAWVETIMPDRIDVGSPAVTVYPSM